MKRSITCDEWYLEQRAEQLCQQKYLCRSVLKDTKDYRFELKQMSINHSAFYYWLQCQIAERDRNAFESLSGTVFVAVMAR